MTRKIYTHDELRDMIVPLLSKYDMASASLFGSYARGEANEGSDIDVLLEGGEGFKALNIFGVAEELHRASGKRVDVYEISELKEGPFREAVMAEAVPLS
ncbi:MULTISPECIES: nucleotidyltransferase family protein [unclassified Adlercreutzia]|uniref:nucleotidyltransferase family protein n=1 Tax=unclassified Adlercreutzia TaxID=2636013 RepID=UPI0013EBC259|nr:MULTISPECIES: nucleotidyltransferase domain-containing protein [unclassified Adlercreutzia]